MSKKPLTREALLSQLEELERASEIGRLNAEIERLTADNASLAASNRKLEAKAREYDETFAAIRKLTTKFEDRQRPIAGTARDAAGREAAGRASRMAMAEVQAGITKGTHNPHTGFLYTAATKPPRDLSATDQRVTSGELARFFPEITGSAHTGTEVPESLPEDHPRGTASVVR